MNISVRRNTIMKFFQKQQSWEFCDICVKRDQDFPPRSKQNFEVNEELDINSDNAREKIQTNSD